MLDDTVISNLLDNIEPRIRSHLSSRNSSSSKRPFILGVTGLQGSGKSTWSSALVKALTSRGFTTRTLSLDDLYLDHEHLVELRTQHPDNKLLRTRGHAGTHDEELAVWFFSQFDGNEILFPSFDKSKFNGEGDRVPRSQWERTEKPLEVLVLEGWCVGFRPLPDDDVEFKLQVAISNQKSEEDGEYFSTHTLANHELSHLLYINSKLRSYCDTFMGPQHFDYMVHLDTDELRNVYVWRLEQEEKLRESRGAGMTDDAVVDFVKGYMPAYELYLDGLRDGFFNELPGFGEKEALVGNKDKSQMRIVLDRDRNVVEMQELDFVAEDDDGDGEPESQDVSRTQNSPSSNTKVSLIYVASIEDV